MGSHIPSHNVSEAIRQGAAKSLGLDDFASPDNRLMSPFTPGTTGMNDLFDPSNHDPYHKGVRLLLEQPLLLTTEIHHQLGKPVVATGYQLPTVVKDPPKIAFDDIVKAAKDLGCEVAMVLAISRQETHGSAFQKDGRPSILYERHIFGKLTKHKWDQSHPEISSKHHYKWKTKDAKADFKDHPTDYYGGVDSYTRMEQAIPLDADAALKSASWGRFQVMGFNFSNLDGCTDVKDFVRRMYASEVEHLNALIGFIKANNLAPAIAKGKEPDFNKFANVYNGGGDPNYAPSLKKHFEQYKLVLEVLDAVEKGPLTTTLSAAVGTKPPATNHKKDGALVQLLLHMTAAPTMSVDGAIGHHTVEAIKSFQTHQMKMKKATGVVEPNSETFKKLQEAADAVKDKKVPAFKEELVK